MAAPIIRTTARHRRRHTGIVRGYTAGTADMGDMGDTMVAENREDTRWPPVTILNRRPRNPRRGELLRGRAGLQKVRQKVLQKALQEKAADPRRSKEKPRAVNGRLGAVVSSRLAVRLRFQRRMVFRRG